MNAGNTGNSTSVRSHVMTLKDIEKMSASIGIRQNGTNYNKLLNGHGTGLAPPSSEEWASMVGSVTVTDSVTQTTGSAGSSYDISSQPYFPIVASQGSQGSCAAWAMTYYSYGYLEAKDNGWTDASTGNPAHLMSPAWTYNMVDRGTDSGSFMNNNAAVITSWGVSSLANMPYIASDWTSWGSEAAFREAPLHRALSYSYLTYNSANGDSAIASIKALLTSDTPVTFAIDAYQYSNGFDNNYIISASEYTSTTYNHAQTIVGYSDIMTEPGHTDVGAFKVVNSWGSSFGDHGYYWITYDTIKKIGGNGVLYATYITDRADYQPVLTAEMYFSTAPSRDAFLSVGIGAVSGTTKMTPYYLLNSLMVSAKYPGFLLLDISDLQPNYASGLVSFYATLGTTRTAGTFSSFKIAQYLNGYDVAPTQASGRSPDVPSANPCTVTVSMVPGTITAPSAPTSVSAMANGGLMTVIWAAPSSNGGSAIIRYDVYRGTASGAETLLSSVAPAATSYNDSTAVAGTTYYYQIAAVNSLGSSIRSAEATGTIVIVVPSTPGGVTAIAGNNSIDLAWTYGGSDIIGFRIFRGTAPGGESLLTTVDYSVLSYLDGSPVIGTAYYYQVRAYNTQANSSASDEVWAKIMVSPNAPTGLSAVMSNDHVSLNWTAPYFNGGSSIIGYDVYRGTASGMESTTPIWTGAANACSDPDVVVGTTYYYEIKAVNSVGSSAASNEASTHVLTVPSVPINLTAAQALGTVGLSWTAPASNGGSPVTSYSICRGTSSSLTDQVSIATVVSTHYDDASVAPSMTYYYTVVASNILGRSNASASISVLIKAVPGALADLDATPSNGTVTLSWTAPANIGFSAVVQYRIYRSTTPMSESLLTSIGAVQSYADGGLQNGRTYYYRVSAVNGMGEGALSTEVSATPATAPNAPVITSAIGANLTVTVNWSVPANGGSAITSYAVYRGATSSLASATSVAPNLSGNSYVDTGLELGTTYYYFVTATNAKGTSAASSPASIRMTSVPSAPSMLGASPSVDHIALGWSAPSMTGSTPITGYAVYRCEAGGSETLLTALGAVLTYNDLSVVTGHTYSYSVAALNTDGVGARSAGMTATFAQHPSAAGLVSVIGSIGSATVTWSAPSSDGGSSITGYAIRMSVAGGAPSTVALAGPNVDSCTVNGLNNGVACSFSVAAVNSVGEGTSSSSMTIIPGAAPGAPTDVSAVAGDGIVTVSWSVPTSNGGISEYRYLVWRSVGGSTIQIVNLSGACLSVIDNAVIAGTAYTYTVQAQNIIGTGPAGGPATILACGLPSAPLDLIAAPGTGSIHLSWSAPRANGGLDIIGYEIHKSDGTGLILTMNLTGAQYGYTDCSVVNGVSYSYTVKACNALGDGPDSSRAVCTITETVPGSFSLTVSVGDQNASLCWGTPSDGGSPIVRFDVYRTDAGVEKLVANVTNNQYTDRSLVAGGDYSYRVVAVNSVGTTSTGNVAVHAVFLVDLGLRTSTTNKGLQIDGYVTIGSTGKAINAQMVTVYNRVGTADWVQLAQLTTSSSGQCSLTIREPAGIAVSIRVVLAPNAYHDSVSLDLNLVGLTLNNGISAYVLSTEGIEFATYDQKLGRIEFALVSPGSAVVSLQRDGIANLDCMHISFDGASANKTLLMTNESYDLTLTGLGAGQTIAADVDFVDQTPIPIMAIMALMIVLGGVVCSVLYVRSKRKAS